MALDMVFGLVGRQSMVGSGDPGEFGEHGSLCLKLPEILSILHKQNWKMKNQFQFKEAFLTQYRVYTNLPHMPMASD